MLDYDPVTRIKPAEALRASFFTDPDAGEGKPANDKRGAAVDGAPQKIISDGTAASGGGRWASPSHKKQQQPGGDGIVDTKNAAPTGETSMETSPATRPGSAPAAAESRDAATQTPERKA